MLRQFVVDETISIAHLYMLVLGRNPLPSRRCPALMIGAHAKRSDQKIAVV
jgi:hypothetical protein